MEGEISKGETKELIEEKSKGEKSSEEKSKKEKTKDKNSSSKTSNLNDIKNNIIILIKSLGENDKESFLKELMKKCNFTKDEFYEAEDNNKINLLCSLQENKILVKVSGEIEKTLNQIINDLNNEKINKKTLEQFFENKEEVIKMRLGLIKLKLEIFQPQNAYDTLKQTLNDIKQDIVALSNIKKSLSIFHRETFREEIRIIMDFISKLEIIKIKEYNDGKIYEPIKNLKTKFELLAKKVDLVQDFLLFKVIYDNAKGKNQDIRFYKAYDKMDEIRRAFVEGKKSIDEIYDKNKVIFDDIKKKLVNNEERTKEFFKTFKIFLFGENKENKENKENIENIENKKLIDDLTLFFNGKKYELDLKGIFYFFNCYNKADEWYKNLTKNYEKLSEKKLEELKENLEQLQKEGIYDHEKKNDYSKFFTSLYEKKEAIIFLRKNIDKDIKKFTDELSDRIDPNSPTLTVQKIIDTGKCIEVFKKFETMKGNKEIFEYIKNLKPEEINAFESYSKVFSSIIELDRNENSALNIFDKVDKIIKNAKFIFHPETEIFKYDEDGKKITMDELIHLKNKINIIPKETKKKEKDKKKEEQTLCDTEISAKKVEEKNVINEVKENDLLKKKSEKLLSFKNLITNMEIIYENMQILRNKGNNLPIDIKITINYDKKKEEEYYLDGEESSFDIIEKFLLEAKDDYKKKLDAAYKDKRHLRFLYGKLFRKLFWYLDGGSFDKIIDIFRYILNKNNDEVIKQSKPTNPTIRDYVNNYSGYNSDSFENMYKYLIALFEANKTSLREEYKKILMIEEEIYKGIYLHECEENSIGKFIYEIFLQKIGKGPIAQNIMICSKETSEEEIQAFLNRAVLCDYNTLFVVEINEFLSDYQQAIMSNYLDELLKYKLDQFKESKEGASIQKEKTRDYMDACIVFIYEQKNKELSLVNEIGKYEKQDIQLNSDKLEESQIQYQKEIVNSNITIITSEKCGLGKSFKIRNMIEKKKQKYFYFPLGGILTKKVISGKLFNLLKMINEENKKEKDEAPKNEKEGPKIKNAIHLDLTESEETSLINEFLFSFLITKFYTDKETIIYIPKNIEIYIEIPNCFKDYLSKFGILNIFHKETITLAKIPKLDLSKEIITTFKYMVELDTNEKIEKQFLQKYMEKKIEKHSKYYIKNQNYSYYQKMIFIKLFISQYSKFKSKIRFVVKNEKGEVIKDNTDDCIRDFAKSATYFLDGEFSDLIMGEIDEEKLKLENKDYIDLLSNAYENDLDGKIFDIPLIFINEEKMVCVSLKIGDIIKNKSNSLKDYLKWMKKMLYIANDVEKEENGLKSLLSILNYKTDNYVITNDNFTKMILLVYRILADIPVIIMGETGCGKTALIIKLSQLLNNGEIVVEIINIHPGITDEYLCNRMEEMNEKAEKQKKELWVFFDEINTCLSLSLLTEIFVNKTFNRKPLNKKIRLIGACNPYRKRKQEIETCGYGREKEEKNNVDLVYLVQPLPQSLLNFLFSFGALNPEDEKKYIYSIIEKLFEKGEEKLHEATKEVIFNCHKYLRDTFDTSVVSLREINRFVKIVEFFKKYFSIKRKCEDNEEDNNIKDDKEKSREQDTKKDNMEKFDKIISIICSVYLCYYIRLIDENKRTQLDNVLKPHLIKLVNLIKIPVHIKKEDTLNKPQVEELNITTDDSIASIKQEKTPNKTQADELNDASNDNLASKIENQYLKSFIQDKNINYFSDFLRLEEQYLIDKIELKKGLGENDLLKENLFLMFVAVTTQIPLIIVGKPGTGKSLSSQLIYNSMRGEYSKDKFFREFPQVMMTYFQGDKSTSPYDVEKLFEMAENKLNYYKNKEEYKNKLPISMILFDELGLAEKSESNPLKVLHSKLEYSGSKEGVSFIGISNYSLGAAKVNRAMSLSVPNLEDKIDQ